jgi:hypothetical protein
MTSTAGPDLEPAYAMLCRALDRVDVEHERVFLAKLVLLLALKLDDDEELARAIDTCLENLQETPPPADRSGSMRP